MKISPASIPEAFDQTAMRHRDRTALAGDTVELTYAQLAAKVDRIASWLRDRGIGRGNTVGLFAQRSVDAIAAILGILKSGAAYVPLDPAYPKKLLQYIYEDSLPSAMLVQDSLVASRPQDVFWKGEALSLDADMDLPAAVGGVWEWPEIEPDDVAYIMYTSGSTGRPKGVVVPHRAVLRLVLDNDFATLGPDEVILQMAPLSFDACTFEIWGALLNGGKLAVVSNPFPSLDDIAAEIARHGVTTMWLTAGLFHLMVDNNLDGLKPLRQLLAGGDVLSPPHILKALRALPGCRLINGYGPTENTTFSCCYTVPKDYNGESALPIGRPIRQTEALILDESLRSVSAGTEGELYVGGTGVALGYLNRPELTVERFIPHPRDPKSKVYKTGDRVRLRADGNIEFLGRQDRQVKINGKRVELDEIEARIRATGLVQDVAVVCPPGTVGHRQIIAFVTGATKGAVDTVDLEHLRRVLRDDLPDYMIPSSINQLESFPLSPTGKVDRARLPAVVTTHVDIRGRAPSNATEASLRDIWRKVLGAQAVGVDDNFFDLGGTSLGLMEVHAHIKRSMSSDITVVEMFQYPRISALAERMTRTAPARAATRGARDRARGEDNLVAIVGMSGRFPGARNVGQFWRNLRDGVESISHFSEAELEDSFSDEVRRQPNFVKARPILDEVDQFDADFFGMYAREAELTDPQHRVFLECAWEALESAGCDPRSYAGSIGVFAGSSINTYFLEHVCRDRRTIEEFTSSYQVGCYPMLLGAGADFLSTRVSYKLDLKGPSISMETACSTSLLTVAQACQSLILGQSDMALAGGVSITFPQKRGYLHLEGGMVSADGTCRTFDANATGTIFGSGAGVVALKRLSDAQRDGDHIFAVIRGFGVNNDGAAKVGFTAPSIDGQAAAIEMAHANAGVDARSISYVECHGTATPLGDPIEVAALTKAFQASTSDKQFCAVGSVKSNIGHLDVGAGIVGLIKTALSLEHGVIPATLHFTAPNPQIDFASTPFYVNSKLTEWPRAGGPRRAGVSAFGVGGTNVHMILEEAPAVETREANPRASELLIVSARSEATLAAARSNLAAHLRANSQESLADVAYSLQVGRRAFEHRSFVVGHTAEDAATKLEGSGSQSRARQTRNPAIAFMFPGQGSQYPDMARDLYTGEPEFRLHFDRCVEICRPVTGEDLAALVYPAANSPEAAKLLMNTKFAQPAIFAVEYSLAKLWMSWGIQPSAMIGHSVGEFVAAVMAGVMSLEDALPLVALRGRLMQDLHRGSMLSVRLPERELRPLLAADVAIAAVNGPSLTVASGPDAAIHALEQTLQARGVICRHLHTSHAFHSSMVEPIVEPLRERLKQIRLSPPTLPYVSCVTGTWIKESEATSTQYWARHARETVRFADGIKTMLAMESSPVLLEVGPGNVLSTLAFQALQGATNPVVTSLQDSARESSDRACMLEALGRLWTHGAEPNWSALHPQPLRRVPLPTYPFERKRYWIDAPPKERGAGSPLPIPGAPADVVVQAPVVSQDDTAMTQQQNNPPQTGQSPQGGRIEELSAAIAAILENLSGSAPPSITAPISFLEMGYDSLFLTQVAQKIQSQMKVKITFRQLLAQYSTIPALAGFLAEKLPASAAPARAPAPAAGTGASAAAAASPGATAMSAGPATLGTMSGAPGSLAGAPGPYGAASSTTYAASAAGVSGFAGAAPTAAAMLSRMPVGVASNTAPMATGAAGLESLFRDQLNSMSQLISRQFDVLQSLGFNVGTTLGAAPAGVGAQAASAAMVTQVAPPATGMGLAAPASPALASAAPASANAGAPAAFAGKPGGPVATAGPQVALAPPAAAPAEESPPSRFAVFNPREAVSSKGISPAQQAHIDDLTARYTRKTAASKRYTQDHRAVLADPRAASGFRTEWKELVYPIVTDRSAGSKLWDLDGNEYVDLVNGFGQTAFGHSPDFVVKAVKEQLDKGFAIGPQAELAGKVAALFCEITGNDRMTFCNTGSEAVMAAMRLARTVTGREKIVIFNGDYHGQFDEVLVKGVQRTGAEPRSVPVAPGIPASAAQNMIVLDYATPETLQWVRDNAEDLAAVIVEPVQSRHPSLQPYEFLREIRKITAASGTAFVMDEVVTGFRTHPGGIQALAGVRADMATYGKVVGGGLPIGVLAGNTTFMDALDGGAWRFGDDSFPEVGVTFFAGTFVRHPLVLASAWAVLQHIKAQGPQMQEKLAKRTSELAADLDKLFTQYGLKAKVETFASWFFFNIHGEHPNATLLFYHLRLRGVHIQDGFPCFLTTAHSEADFKLIYDAFAESVAALNAVGILGTPPQELAAAVAVAAGAAAAGAAFDAASDTRGIAGLTGAAGASNGSADAGIPLTESQTEIWLAAQMSDEASCAFNESVSLTLRGSLNEPALRTALSFLFERHNALRATFTATGEEMRISAAQPVDLPIVDLAARPDAQSVAEQIIADDARTPFDLVKGPAARVQLLRLAPDHHVLMFTAHHIIVDGWSINVVVSELAEIYPVLCQGGTPQLAPALRFSTYARDQARRDPEEAAKTESFWLGQYREPVKTLDLPTDRPRPALKSYSGSSRCRRIEASLYQSLKKSGAKAGNTLFVTLLGAFQALIGRLCDQPEVVVGVPTAGQSLLEDQILVGHCVNFLPIRASWSQNTTIGEHLRAVSKSVLDAYEHQSYTLGTLVRKLQLAREQNRVPLAEIQFNLERLADQIRLPGLNIEVAPNSKAAVNFDLFLNVIESESGLRLDCDYNTDLFDAATVDLWLDCYQALLESIVADPAIPVLKISYLPAAERQRVVLDYNRTQAPFPDRSVQQLFEMQVAERPQAIAAQFRDDSISYETLNRRANQLANHLLSRIGSEPAGKEQRLIGVAVERSLDMLVALLATMKAGCAYVPLDPTHPSARLRHILTDAKVAALITDGSVDSSVVPVGTAAIHLKTEIGDIAASSPTAPRIAVSKDSVAYVIYTSGSTGLPKGVAVPHGAVVNFLTSMAREPGLTKDDVLLAVTTISFDIAGLELYLPLVVGGKVVIAEREEVIDGFVLLLHMEQCGATVMQATPATWRILLEAGFRAKAGFRMLCGGEALPRELANRLLEGTGTLWNMYGPTETTIWSSCTRVTVGDAPITVGKPIANTQFYVLDRQDQPVPPGVAGQLHIGGDGVARGYHNRPDLTGERFVKNPFQAGRMYRTGDLAKWLPDGELQVLGRIDHQIKLRGFRIELGEIEAALMRQNTLSAVAVLLREDNPGAPRLVAYYVEPAGHAQLPAQLVASIADDLPEYMIPSAWMKLERLPVSPNGKLERAALPVPEVVVVNESEFLTPATPTEVGIAKIWAEVLHLSRVGANMDLLKLGADSIQLFQIVARSSREGFRLTAKELLQLRTVRAVAASIDDAASKGTSEEPGGRKALPSLSQFQRGRRTASTTKR
jgi:amino acid adenylation domain-containing protein